MAWRWASDDAQGAIHPALAHFLGLPLTTLAGGFVGGSTLRVTRVPKDG